MRENRTYGSEGGVGPNGPIPTLSRRSEDLGSGGVAAERRLPPEEAAEAGVAGAELGLGDPRRGGGWGFPFTICHSLFTWPPGWLGIGR